MNKALAFSERDTDERYLVQSIATINDCVVTPRVLFMRKGVPVLLGVLPLTSIGLIAFEKESITLNKAAFIISTVPILMFVLNWLLSTKIENNKRWMRSEGYTKKVRPDATMLTPPSYRALHEIRTIWLWCWKLLYILGAIDNVGEAYLTLSHVDDFPKECTRHNLRDSFYEPQAIVEGHLKKNSQTARDLRVAFGAWYETDAQPIIENKEKSKEPDRNQMETVVVFHF
ncbi:MAG: hypothetical protein KGL39_01275 [Patescibacteria group bacterium]|nr:hypothetical protein [Patescibacteria group bacterium]